MGINFVHQLELQVWMKYFQYAMWEYNEFLLLTFSSCTMQVHTWGQKQLHVVTSRQPATQRLARQKAKSFQIDLIIKIEVMLNVGETNETQNYLRNQPWSSGMELKWVYVIHKTVQLIIKKGDITWRRNSCR